MSTKVGKCSIFLERICGDARRRSTSALVAKAFAGTSWGEWLWRRAKFIGVARRQDLAAAVGCTRQQLARWLKLKSPLPRMRRGYDDGLARALKVDRNTLFYDWEVVDPEDAAMVITPAGLEVPWKFDDPAKAELVKAINQAVSSLPIQDIAAVLAFARSTREERLKVGEPGESQRRRDLLVLPPIRLRKKQ